MRTQIFRVYLFLPVLVNAWTKPWPTTTCHIPEKQCGNRVCCCHEAMARCSRLGGNLTYIPALPSYITKLHFTYNSLTTLSRSTFQSIAKLSIKELQLSYNKILGLAPDTFEDLRNLSKLYLDHNSNMNKTELSLALGSIQKVRELERLVLDNTGLTELPDNFFLPMNGSKVRDLHLNENGLKSVEIAAFRFLPILQMLKLGENQIQNFNASYGHRILQKIVLTRNEIARQAPEFCPKEGQRNPYPNLHQLYLDENYISQIESSSWDCLTHLMLLDLRMNVLRKIPNNVFAMLTSLKELRLNQMMNSNMKLSPRAFNSSSLEKLNLGKNNIVLKADDVNNNYFKYCPNLISLDISSNSLKNLHGVDVTRLLSPLVRLKTLLMVSCHLFFVPPKLFISLQDLQVLVLDGNHISNLDEAFQEAHNLESLALQANSIKLIGPTTFPKNVRKTIQNITLADNPFECTCDLLWFRTSISDNGVLVGTNITLLNWPKRYKCRFPSKNNGMFLVNYRPTKRSCQKSHFHVVIISVLGSLLLLTFIVTPVGYRYRWYISYWIYRWKQKPDVPEVRPLLGDRPPYFYVIYNDGDRSFVHNDFRKIVEEDLGFNLYIWHRDAEMGAKADVMFNGIHGSSHVIAIVSKKFISDNWSEFQLNVATYIQIDRQKDFLTLVILEDVNKALLERSWCVRLTRFETLYWCSDLEDIRRKVFDHQIRIRLSNRN